MSSLQRIVPLSLLAALATAAAPVVLPRLPGPVALPRGEASPGQVTFDHATHVNAARPACTGCHPKLFKIVKRAEPKPAPLEHAVFEKGGACGACHNGTAAFDLSTCELCHQEPTEGAAP